MTTGSPAFSAQERHDIRAWLPMFGDQHLLALTELVEISTTLTCHVGRRCRTLRSARMQITEQVADSLREAVDIARSRLGFVETSWGFAVTPLRSDTT